MKIISIETSGPVCGIALSDNKNITAEYSASGGNIHDKLCAEFVRRILDDFELTISDIDAIAVSAGPGSFTGLRIGASIAKALCFKENDKDYAPKLISVPTLSSFAYEAVKFVELLTIDKIIAAIPAQKDILYYQEFDKFGKETSEIIMTEQSDFNRLDFKNILVCGPYSVSMNDILSMPFLQNHSAKFISQLAVNMFEKGNFSDPAKFKPIYIQEFQPKTKRKKLDI
ncbi:tRNA (adenosine(37)-N6)-threonylcarbamoyltransferase complex dimerization subunit type 1 TsaB [Bacteroidota bacterium]